MREGWCWWAGWVWHQQGAAMSEDVDERARLETLKSNQRGCPAQAPTIACPYCPAVPCRRLPVQQQR